MSKIDWAKAKPKGRQTSIGDENKRRDHDPAARFLAKMGWPDESKAKSGKRR